MTTPDGHPRTRLDDTIHAPVRLSIMAALAGADRVEFRYLRDLLEVSDSLLSKHMTILENAGHIEIIKGYLGKRPRTWLTLTESGRMAYSEYVATLTELLGQAPSSQVPAWTGAYDGDRPTRRAYRTATSTGTEHLDF